MRPSSKRLLRERTSNLKSSDASWLGCVVLPAVFILVAWLTGILLASACIIAAIVIVGWLLNLVQETHETRLLAARRGESICTFARSFDCRANDTLIIRAVYERLQCRLSPPVLPMRADDNLYEVFDLDDMDIDFTAEEVALLTDRPLADMKSNPYYGKVCTPRDLVHFFCCQPRCQILNLQF